jgi:hypothetical protein
MRYRFGFRHYVTVQFGRIEGKSKEENMEKFKIIFYNRFACQTQLFEVEAKNKLSARHKFWEEYPRKSYLDCIENIF